MEHSLPDLVPEPYVLGALEPDERLRAHARAREAVLAVSDRRLIVAAQERVALSIGFDELRRIQFDIERDRPATMVIVPEEAHHEPQVLAIPPQEFRATADALAIIGEQLARLRRDAEERATDRGQGS
jgi:hypothetical protein